MPVIGQLVAAGMPQHMGMDPEHEPGLSTAWGSRGKVCVCGAMVSPDDGTAMLLSAGLKQRCREMNVHNLRIRRRCQRLHRQRPCNLVARRPNQLNRVNCDDSNSEASAPQACRSPHPRSTACRRRIGSSSDAPTESNPRACAGAIASGPSDHCARLAATQGADDRRRFPIASATRSRFQVAFQALRPGGGPSSHVDSAMLFSAFRPVVLNERKANILLPCL
jgi:hypothetical protein